MIKLIILIDMEDFSLEITYTGLSYTSCSVQYIGMSNVAPACALLIVKLDIIM